MDLDYYVFLIWIGSEIGNLRSVSTLPVLAVFKIT